MKSFNCLRILSSILLIVLGSTANSQDLELNVPQPQKGDDVCQAYASEYKYLSPLSRFENNLHLITDLPIKYCKNGKALSGSILSKPGQRLRVVAVGDIYTFSPKGTNKNTVAHLVDPQFSDVACQARSFNPEGKIIYLQHLSEKDCYTGATFMVTVKGITELVHVEWVDNFHYAPKHFVQYAETLEKDEMNDSQELILPASVEI